VSHDVELEEIQHLLESHRYRAAKSPSNPHEHTLRREWPKIEDFFRCVRYIRERSFRCVVLRCPPAPGNPPYRKLRLNGYVYWSIGWPVPEMVLINRARVEDYPSQPEFVKRPRRSRRPSQPELQPKLPS